MFVKMNQHSLLFGCSQKLPRVKVRVIYDENPRGLPPPVKKMLVREHVREQKERARKIERVVSEYSETAGKVLSTLNSCSDSLENVAKACDPEERHDDSINSYSVEEAKKVLQKGDHIKCNRSVYSHHGIYAGEGEVIAYDDFIIQNYSLREFADGDSIVRVEDEKAAYSPEEIVRRARSRLGESEYNLLWNNCENFATWCRCGKADSD